ncbi:hypothetical protein Tco_0697918 [Tanacetum coccineum]
MTPKEPTYQVVLDTLALTTCYPAFLITASFPVIYMQQFWATINTHEAFYRFKIGKKRFSIDMEVFRVILQICPRLPDQEFDELPSKEEILSFIKDLGHTGNIKKITDVVIDHMHQLWRDFAAIINKEDLAFQIDNCNVKKQEKMYYPRFTKAIIYHFLTKDKSILMRNKMFIHTAQDDSILGNLRFVSKDEDNQVYGALIFEVMTTPKIRESPAYQTYFAFATGEATLNPKRIYKKTSSPIIKTRTTYPNETPSKKKTAHVMKYFSSKKPSRKKSTGVQIRDTLGVSESKKKAPITNEKSKGIELLSEAALLEDGDSGEDDDSNDNDSDDGNDDDSDNDNDDERIESDSDHNDDDKEEECEEEYVHTPKNYESTDDEDKHVDKEEYDHFDEELYKDVNVKWNVVEHGEEWKEDVEITDAGKDDVTQEKSYEQVEDDAHVTLTQKIKDPLQSSSISSDFADQFLNLDNILPAYNEVMSMMNVKVRHEEPSNQTPSILTIHVTLIPETLTVAATTVPLPIPPVTTLP